MAVSHVKTSPAGDWTGTVTIHNSQASTTTTQATALLRPSDWNSAHNQFFTLSGNTNNASTASGTNIVLQGLGDVTLVGSTATIGISVDPGPVIDYRMFAPFDENVHVAGQVGQATLHFYPFVMAGELQHDRIAFRVLFSNNTNSTGSVTISQWCGLYTRNVSTLSLLSSTSTTRGHTFSGTVGNFSLQHGIRNMTIPWTNTITEGDYWMGIVSRTTSGGANMSFSQLVGSQIASSYSGILGAASNASDQRRLGFGVFSASTSSMPNSVAFTDLRGNSSDFARPPVWFLMSQSI